MAMPFLGGAVSRAFGAEGKLRHACIGTGGMGWSDLQSLHSHPELEIVALCDVDANNLAKAAEVVPGARRYRDWRELLDKEDGRIDSVNVTTPDHMHAPIAITALRMGKHVYCQKPLAHEIGECRQLEREAAGRPDQVTQMGIQIHSHIAYRMAVRMVQAGLVGKIREVHSWCGKGWVGVPGELERRPDGSDPVPEYLDWDLWLGTAPRRPYVANLYHPANWRRWIDFGTGTQGDMACHIMDPVFTALELTAPKWIFSEGSPPFAETYSPNNRITHMFPGTEYTAEDTLRYYWYDSGAHPDPEQFELPEGQELPMQGSVFVGEKGDLLLPHIGGPQPLPRERFTDAIRAFRAENEFENIDHYHQFVDACLGRGRTTAPFAYGGRLSETVLMGCIANRIPDQKLEWNAEELRFTNNRQANLLLHREYRSGWSVDGLG